MKCEIHGVEMRAFIDPLSSRGEQHACRICEAIQYSAWHKKEAERTKESNTRFSLKHLDRARKYDEEIASIKK